MKKKKHPRVFRTTEEALQREEEKLGRAFPPSFRDWLISNNGLGLDGIHIYPVLDDRDIRRTWNSLARNYEEGWMAWLENFEEERDFDYLLPFADFGTGDYYCFDCSQAPIGGEPPVVRWSHETGETEFRAITFAEFVQKAEAGEYKSD